MKSNRISAMCNSAREEMGWRLSEELWKVSSQARVMGLGICPLYLHTLLHVTMCLLHNCEVMLPWETPRPLEVKNYNYRKLLFKESRTVHEITYAKLAT